MYKQLLIFRYLRKRRIAWVSLIAVTLCTALMLVVISVMGGWLRMFRQSFHGLSGDVLVQSTSMSGFPHYDEMVKRIEALPNVGKGNAVPVIKTFGLIKLNDQITEGVQVLGYPIQKIGNVNEFPASLYRQHVSREEAAAKLKDPKITLTADERAYYQRLAADKSAPSFDLVQDVSVYLDQLPADVKFPEAIKAKVVFLPGEHLLQWHGPMSEAEAEQLVGLSTDSHYRLKIDDLYRLADFRGQFPKLPKAVDPGTWPGIILGDGVAKIRKNESGQTVGRESWLYRMPVTLTVLGIPPKGPVDFSSDPPAPHPYFVVDDSRTKVYQYDSQTVYVSFDRLQTDLGMTEKLSEDNSVAYPARTSEIDIRIQPTADLNQTRNQIAEVCDAVMREKYGAKVFDAFRVQTWEESNRVWLHAIENEKVLVMFLFGLISVVAVFLIFCIFYMIVVEKTRDIGIIKSVGATSTGVAGIFLGYGLAIGIVGAGLGMLMAYLIVHNINELHTWMGHRLGIVIWDPQVYAFDTIPNQMDPKETTIIVIVAVLSAVMGALLPAIRAARLHPVEALRWE
jgi:lipoprotein-releasing system permease protein